MADKKRRSIELTAASNAAFDPNEKFDKSFNPQLDNWTPTLDKSDIKSIDSWIKCSDDGISSATFNSQNTLEKVVDTRCGYGQACKPDCLQKFASPKSYLIILSLCMLIQGK